jgi:hypothetical protein
MYSIILATCKEKARTGDLTVGRVCGVGRPAHNSDGDCFEQEGTERTEFTWTPFPLFAPVQEKIFYDLVCAGLAERMLVAVQR